MYAAMDILGDFRLTLEETKRLRPLHCGERYMVHSRDILSVCSFSALVLVCWTSRLSMWIPLSAIL